MNVLRWTILACLLAVATADVPWWTWLWLLFFNQNETPAPTPMPTASPTASPTLSPVEICPSDLIEPTVEAIRSSIFNPDGSPKPVDWNSPLWMAIDSFGLKCQALNPDLTTSTIVSDLRDCMALSLQYMEWKCTNLRESSTEVVLNPDSIGIIVEISGDCTASGLGNRLVSQRVDVPAQALGGSGLFGGRRRLLQAPTTETAVISSYEVTIPEQVRTDCPRIRREIRDLSPAEFQNLVDAMWIMKTTDTETGRATYGENFENIEDQLVKHAVGFNDPRGDQGHNGPAFQSFHRMVVLRFERSLLSITATMSPGLEAMPYWDSAMDDADSGIYSGTEKSIYSDNYFGPFEGLPENSWQIVTGPFANWPIGEWTEEKYGEYADIWQGSQYTGLLRDTLNVNEIPNLTRFPKWAFLPVFGNQDIGGWVGGPELTFNKTDESICVNPYWIDVWMDWQRCIEFHSLEVGTSYVYEEVDGVATQINNAHSAAHVKTGAQMPGANADGTLTSLEELKALMADFSGGAPSQETLDLMQESFDAHIQHMQAHMANAAPPEGLPDIRMGDMMDVATSPNDPLFMFHHANTDRLLMEWMQNILEVHPEYSDDDVLWKYPTRESLNAGRKTSGDTGISGPYLNEDTGEYFYNDGHYLNDVVSGNAPFRGMFGNDDANTPADGYTHKDVLLNTKPSNSPYITDTMIARLGISPECNGAR